MDKPHQGFIGINYPQGGELWRNLLHHGSSGIVGGGIRFRFVGNLLTSCWSWSTRSRCLQTKNAQQSAFFPRDRRRHLRRTKYRLGLDRGEHVPGAVRAAGEQSSVVVAAPSMAVAHQGVYGRHNFVTSALRNRSVRAGGSFSESPAGTAVDQIIVHIDGKTPGQVAKCYLGSATVSRNTLPGWKGENDCMPATDLPRSPASTRKSHPRARRSTP